MMRLRRTIAFLLCLCTPSLCAASGDLSARAAPVSLYGALGLNTVPDARHDPAGTIRLHTGALDPYAHAAIGFQVTDGFHISARQTALISSLRGDPERLYPGLDMKLRLLRENGWRPEISAGFLSAIGHRRMASEYLVASKRYGDFDFTAGLAWGRLGSAHQVRNPLAALLPHFGKRRPLDGEDTSDPGDWFTGRHIGLMAGVAYDTPIDGLVLTADIGSDRYRAEKALSGEFDAPSPFAVALHYPLYRGVQFSAGLAGTDKVMARISFSDAGIGRTAPPFTADRPAAPLSTQEGTATYLWPRALGLRAPGIQVIDAPGRSPEEVARTVRFAGSDMVAPPSGWFWPDTQLFFDAHISMMEEEAAMMTRQQAGIEARWALPLGLSAGVSWGVNTDHNIGKLNSVRRPRANSVRGDVYDFAARTSSVNRFYGALTRTLADGLHAALQAGYLEEMFFGIGGDLLYRPADTAFALGVSYYQARKRDPFSHGAFDLHSQKHDTGLVSLYYAVPDSATRLRFDAGRYLAGDWGGGVSVWRDFDNGMALGAYARATGRDDADPFGGDQTSIYGVRLAWPLGRVHRLAPDMVLRARIEPMARDAGQMLDTPVDLYALSEELETNRVLDNWSAHRQPDGQ